MADRSVRSYEPVTDADLVRLRELALERASEMRAKRPDWCSELLAACLVQGAARHRLRGDRGVKDLDVYLFFARPETETDSQSFPFNRGGIARDFGTSAHGRQLYTAADWADVRLSKRISRWEEFAGRRVDVLARSVERRQGAQEAVVAWLERREGSAAFLAETPVIALEPELGAVWWTGPDDDPLGTAKGAYDAS